jgi:hypothetical protein
VINDREQVASSFAASKRSCGSHMKSTIALPRSFFQVKYDSTVVHSPRDIAESSVLEYYGSHHNRGDDDGRCGKADEG